MLLDAYSGAFTTEYSELEAYADELLRSNSGSTVKVDLCKDELSKGKRVFKIIFVCLDACKKRWKAGCWPIIGLDGRCLKTSSRVNFWLI